VTSLPDNAAMKPDLTDAELDELDALLQATPPPHEPLDVLMLDGARGRMGAADLRSGGQRAAG
jgi:hypothetical protein